MHEWLEAASGRLAAEAGASSGELSLDRAQIDELLELARIAAHESGERINAPLALLGLSRNPDQHPRESKQAEPDRPDVPFRRFAALDPVERS